MSECKFPAIDNPSRPCGDVAIDSMEITLPDRGDVISIPICEVCYYRAIKLQNWQIIDMIKKGQIII